MSNQQEAKAKKTDRFRPRVTEPIAGDDSLETAIVSAVVEEATPNFEDVEDLILSEINIDPNIDYEFELLERNITKYIYPAKMTIFDPIQKRQRDIRYIKSSQTVFEEMQNDVVPGYSQNQITFECPQWAVKEGGKAKLKVSGKDKNLMIYLLLSHQIEGSRTSTQTRNRKPLFRLIDQEKISKAKLHSLDVELKARNKAYEMEDADMMPYAYVVGIPLEMPMTERRIRFVEYAGKHPLDFLKLINDPTATRQYVVKLGLDRNIITNTLYPNQLYWVKDNVKIISLSPDKDHVSFIADWCFTDEGKAFYNQLERLVK